MIFHFSLFIFHFLFKTKVFMTTQKTWALTAFFAISGLTTTHAEDFEANDSDFDNVTLKNVSIVGTKVNKHNLTPSSVSVMGSHQIQANQIGNIEDLSSQLPNIFIPEYGSRQTTPIIMRGIYSKVKGTAYPLRLVFRSVTLSLCHFRT